MEKHSVDAIVGALNAANVRYLVADGLAVVAHGYVRFTAEFADPQKRAQWVRDRNLTVFSVHSPRHALTEVDIFVEPPLDFEVADRTAVRKDVAPGVAATFVGIEELRRLKRQAGRPQDLLDLEKLASVDAEARDE